MADRYTTSNAVHQTGKLPREEWETFLRWLEEYEYDHLGLPRPDLVLWLDMPTQQAVSFLRQREAESQTRGDIHEMDVDYLAQCRQVAQEAARLGQWRRISCVDGEGRVRTPEEIHEEIWSIVSQV